MLRGVNVSYFINYCDFSEKEHYKINRKSRIPILSALFFVMFLLVVKGFWGEGEAVISRLLWSEDWLLIDKVVQYSFAAMRNGQPFSEAVQGFCREIVHEAMALG